MANPVDALPTYEDAVKCPTTDERTPPSYTVIRSPIFPLVEDPQNPLNQMIDRSVINQEPSQCLAEIENERRTTIGGRGCLAGCCICINISLILIQFWSL